ncbi:uncharacterized protein [Solanum tuberosum]|uniref:uncharacterized protein isoform X2 n=1 Tax=Solanum tuberosum TaxID=4113 RepID=UPI0003D26400|nr:PREDICTED: uncharacterized protein LOC102578403 isoform X2 [Solanum tuberosum]
MGHLHLLSPLLLFSFIVVSSTATHLQFGRPPSSHLGSPLLFACSKFCTLVESTAASYISECNYYSPQGTCSITTNRNHVASKFKWLIVHTQLCWRDEETNVN